MTHHDFNDKLLLAKDTALDTLEDLCGQAFPRRKGIPQTRPDGTPLTWEEKEAHRLAQPPRLDAEEQHVLVMERNQRMRAAATILKTRPIGEDGNPLPPLPISRRHPEHHTRTRPRQRVGQDSILPDTPAAPDRDSTNPEGGRERAGNDAYPTTTTDNTDNTTAADNTNTPTTNASPRPEDAPPQPAASAAGTPPNNISRSGGATNPTDTTNGATHTTPTPSSAHPGRNTPHQRTPAGEPGGAG